MLEKTAVAKLIDRAPLAVIVIGVLLLITGAAGGLPIGEPPLQVADYGWRISVGAIGAILVISGLLLLWRETTRVQAEQQREKNLVAKYGIKIESPREGKQIGDRVEVSGTFLIQPPENELRLFIVTPDSGAFWPRDIVTQFDLQSHQWWGYVTVPSKASPYFVDIVVALVGKSSQAWLRYYSNVVARMTGGVHIDGPFPADILECSRVRVERV
jgi:hypothetical protein